MRTRKNGKKKLEHEHRAGVRRRGDIEAGKKKAQSARASEKTGTALTKNAAKMREARVKARIREDQQYRCCIPGRNHGREQTKRNVVQKGKNRTKQKQNRTEQNKNKNKNKNKTKRNRTKTNQRRSRKKGTQKKRNKTETNAETEKKKKQKQANRSETKKINK